MVSEMSRVLTPRIKPHDVCSTKQGQYLPPDYVPPTVAATTISIANGSPMQTGRPQTAPSRHGAKPQDRNPLFDGQVDEFKPAKRQYAPQASQSSLQTYVRGKGAKPGLNMSDCAGFVPSMKPERPLLKRVDTAPKDQMESQRTSHKAFTVNSSSLEQRDPIGQKGFVGTNSVKNSVPGEHRPERRMFADKVPTMCPSLEQMVNMGTQEYTRPQRTGKPPEALLSAADTASRVLGMGAESPGQGANRQFQRRPMKTRNDESQSVIQYRHSAGICPESRATMDRSSERRNYEQNIRAFHNNTMSSRQEMERNKAKASAANNILGDFQYRN